MLVQMSSGFMLVADCTFADVVDALAHTQEVLIVTHACLHVEKS